MELFTEEGADRCSDDDSGGEHQGNLAGQKLPYEATGGIHHRDEQAAADSYSCGHSQDVDQQGYKNEITGTEEADNRPCSE